MECLRPIKIRRFKETGTPVPYRSEILSYPSNSFPYRPVKTANLVGINEYVNVPCGKCEACQANYRQQWAMRLYYEWRYAKTAAFCTLTYRDSCLRFNENGVASVFKEDVQLFMHRFRKHFARKYPEWKERIRYFLISEYGDEECYTMRPHYHFLLFNYPPMDFLLLSKAIFDTWKKHDLLNDKIAEPVTGQRIGYCAGYISTKRVAPKGANPNFMLSSRRPGIGSAYLTPNRIKFHYDSCDMSVKTESGTYPLARYFKDKIMDDDMKVRNVQLYREYIERKNIKKYGYPAFDVNWTDDEAISHGIPIDKFHLLRSNELEKRQSWVDAFNRKRLHKHVKI